MDKGPSEIAKLTERISKDPKSKLFVPLAEEYKKTGDIDMSIQVLQEGLKNNPAYVTARSILGRLLIEKGDLSGARKEFEEVVKAIPDNLIAHKKLGDIYALQGRPADALGQYKTVLMLNPKDAETVMLVSEIEAGRDIKKHLAKPAASEDPQKSQEQRVSPAPAAKLQAAPLSKQPEAIQAATPAVQEEPEEVLVVEPLDSPETGSLEQQLAASNMGFLAETPEELVETQVGEKADLFADGDPFAAGETPPAQMAGVLEKPEAAPSEFAAEPEKQADDFTTDTLAELYISQGFYEKAIDIYERMLVDKPNSQGLKDKLEKVRAMAAAAPVQETEEVTSFNIPAGLDTDPLSGDAHAGEQDSGIGAFVPPDDQPAPALLDEWEPAATNTVPIIEENVLPAQHRSEPKHFDVGFEPREYVPPDAVLRKQEETAGEVKGSAGVNQAGEQQTTAVRKSPASKKETIERLEGWLKNIMKEN